MPTTPGCQPSPCTISTARPVSAWVCAAAWAASITDASSTWRCWLTWSSRIARARASTGSSLSSRRRPRSASSMRPAALMRGPSAHPSVVAVGISLASEISSRAAMPGRWRLAITFSPCVTRARLTPVSGITSQTVASATRSSSSRRSGSGRVVNQPARRRVRSVAMAARNATPAAHSPRSPEVSSSRLGFTVASTAGGGPSALWWSSTSTSARPASTASVSPAAVPQSTHTTSVAPLPARASRAGALGPYPSRIRSGTWVSTGQPKPRSSSAITADEQAPSTS